MLAGSEDELFLIVRIENLLRFASNDASVFAFRVVERGTTVPVLKLEGVGKEEARRLRKEGIAQPWSGRVKFAYPIPNLIPIGGVEGAIIE